MKGGEMMQKKAGHEEFLLKLILLAQLHSNLLECSISAQSERRRKDAEEGRPRGVPTQPNFIGIISWPSS
jgi:hypothetical protein